MEKPTADAATRQFLSFQVGGVDCAADLSHVREIVRYEEATRVPRVPSSVRGVVNLRGSVVPVIDLAVGFGMAATDVTPQACLLVVEMAVGGERAVVGLLADAVSQVLELRADELEPVPSFGTPLPPAFLLGMARTDGGFALLLDLARLVGEGALLDGTAAGRSAPAPAPALAGGGA
jgi:purine-binding chemotaxis protein CheW